MSVKRFTFNASSFALDPAVENLLKSKGAIAIDFGMMQYVSSEAMPAILSELVERSKLDAPSDVDFVAKLKAEIGRIGAEKQKMMEDNVRLASELRSHSTEGAALKEKAEGTAKVIESLKAENMRLQIDATVLAKLYASGFLPEVWVPDGRAAGLASAMLRRALTRRDLAARGRVQVALALLVLVIRYYIREPEKQNRYQNFSSEKPNSNYASGQLLPSDRMPLFNYLSRKRKKKISG